MVVRIIFIPLYREALLKVGRQGEPSNLFPVTDTVGVCPMCIYNGYPLIIYRFDTLYPFVQTG